MDNAVLNASASEHRERLFFLIMAGVIAMTVVLAFGLFLHAGYSTFNAPWWVHIHAVTFSIWIVLYLTQNILVYRNNLAVHRKLGRMIAIYAVWVLVVGLILTPVTVMVGRLPPFFTPGYFLALDWTNIVVFAVLFFAAIVNCKRTDWHRRLMLCATVSLIAPAIGRLILLSGYELTTLNNVGVLLGYILLAMVADRFIQGRVHPAYIWGFAALVGMGVLIEILAAFPPFIDLAGQIAG